MSGPLHTVLSTKVAISLYSDRVVFHSDLNSSEDLCITKLSPQLNNGLVVAAIQMFAATPDARKLKELSLKLRMRCLEPIIEAAKEQTRLRACQLDAIVTQMRENTSINAILVEIEQKMKREGFNSSTIKSSYHLIKRFMNKITLTLPFRIKYFPHGVEGVSSFSEIETAYNAYKRCNEDEIAISNHL